LNAPLPVACKTALAHLADGKPRLVYDGDYEFKGEVEREPCLARLWPEFSLLVAAGGWPDLAEALYGGLAAWIANHIQVTQHAGDAA
jgi:exodeoxyribonuclease V gamma subunit